MKQDEKKTLEATEKCLTLISVMGSNEEGFDLTGSDLLSLI